MLTTVTPKTVAGPGYHPKFTVGYIGGEKTGKSHALCSWPKPIAILNTDTNVDTVEGFMADGADITYYTAETENDVREFVMMVANRKLRARSVGVDTWSMLSDIVTRKFSGDDGTSKVERNEWNQILNLHQSYANWLTRSAKPMFSKTETDAEGNPRIIHGGYHIIATAHLEPRYKQVGPKDNRETIIDSMNPSIQGRFGTRFGRVWGSTFLTDTEVAMVPEDPTKPDGPKVRRKRYFVHTIPPSSLFKCGDGVGGKGGRNELPPTIGGTYPELCAGWGIPVEPDGLEG